MMRKVAVVSAVLLVCLCVSAAAWALEFRVAPLPGDNLVVNPWFRTGDKPSLAGWTTTAVRGGWVASQKQGNPTPDETRGYPLDVGRNNGGRPSIPGLMAICTR